MERFKIWLDDVVKIHNNKYDYSLVQYKNVDTKVCIICPLHGQFWKTPYHHKQNKQGCLVCNKIKISKKSRLSKEKFINISNNIHENKYDYSLVEYINAHIKVNIICPKHGVFHITPNNHIYGIKSKGGKIGCSACSNNISYTGTKWLDSFKNPNIDREVVFYIGNKKFKFDGFDKQTNTVYEFFGSFWHGNPEKFNQDEIHPRIKKTFGELYKDTCNKIEIIKSAGFNLIYIWD